MALIPTGIISEFIVRANGQPIYSGSKFGAQNAINAAITDAINEGRAEPYILVSQRSVNYDKLDQDATKVGEVSVNADFSIPTNGAQLTPAQLAATVDPQIAYAALLAANKLAADQLAAAKLAAQPLQPVQHYDANGQPIYSVA
jgi:hypothetical protein